jgi:hypothetical protein
MSTKSKATPADVAAWMVQELQRDGVLYQDVAASGIQGQFGEAFVYFNNNGNLAIDKRVLAEFQKLTRDSVVWLRGERMWRKREEFDERGRRQV